MKLMDHGWFFSGNRSRAALMVLNLVVVVRVRLLHCDFLTGAQCILRACDRYAEEHWLHRVYILVSHRVERPRSWAFPLRWMPTHRKFIVHYHHVGLPSLLTCEFSRGDETGALTVVHPAAVSWREGVYFGSWLFRQWLGLLVSHGIQGQPCVMVG